MSRDGCVAFPHGAMGLSAVCDMVFPDHTHLLVFENLWIGVAHLTDSSFEAVKISLGCDAGRLFH